MVTAMTSFKNNLHLFIYLHACMCVCAHTLDAQRSENTLRELILSFWHTGPWGFSQRARLPKNLYSLGHLSSRVVVFLRQGSYSPGLPGTQHVKEDDLELLDLNFCFSSAITVGIGHDVQFKKYLFTRNKEKKSQHLRALKVNDRTPKLRAESLTNLLITNASLPYLALHRFLTEAEIWKSCGLSERLGSYFFSYLKFFHFSF